MRVAAVVKTAAALVAVVAEVGCVAAPEAMEDAMAAEAVAAMAMEVAAVDTELEVVVVVTPVAVAAAREGVVKEAPAEAMEAVKRVEVG